MVTDNSMVKAQGGGLGKEEGKRGTSVVVSAIKINSLKKGRRDGKLMC